MAATCRPSCSTPSSITKDTVKDVIDDGGQSAADVCAGEYAAALHGGRHLLITASLHRQ